MSEEKTIFSCQGLSKVYGKHRALDQVSLEIRRGEIYGLVGRNGAGKTTLMKLITGLAYPNGGSLALFEERERLVRNRSRIGAIIETPEFFPYMNATDNLKYFVRQRGLGGKANIAQCLEMSGLAEVGKKKFKAFSLGMKQRLGLALALLGRPEFLILDEPVNGIDPEGIVALRKLFVRLNQEFGMTIMVSSHILSELSQVATRFAIIDEGQILDELSAEELDAKNSDCLELSVDEPEKAKAILRRELSLSAENSATDSSLILREGQERAVEISRCLIENGIGLSAMSRRHISLEDYYLQLIHSRGGRNALAMRVNGDV